MNIVGKDHPINDARGKVSGQLRYTADQSLPHMLYASMVFSSIPHGKVLSVDASEALKLKGVHAVFDCFNAGKYRFNRFKSMVIQGELPEEEQVFSSYVRFVGDRVGAVVAVSQEIAEYAASLIKVNYESYPAAFSFEDTLAAVNALPGENPIKDEFTMETGEKAAENEESIRISVTTELARLHHAALEPHSCIASFDPNSRELSILSPNQSVHGIRLVVSDMLSLPYSRVSVKKAVMGGSFGAKQEWFLEPVASLLSYRLARPVKLVYSRADCMRSTICRGAMRAVTEGEFLPDGTLRSVHFDILLDAGAYLGNSLAYIRTLYGKMFRCYRVPYGSMHGRVISSNTPVSGAFRGWSGPEAAVFLEHLMEKAAETLRLDPIELRLKNVLLPGEKDHKSGISMENVKTAECLRLGREKFQWERKKAEDAVFNAKNHRFRRGIGVGCGGHGNTYFPRYLDFAAAELRMCEDGSFIADLSLHDHGCGTTTAFQMILSEVLCVPPVQIMLKEADSSHCPYDFGCFASRTTYVVGKAAELCARKMRKKLLEAAAAIHQIPEEELYFDGAVLRSKKDEKLRISYREIGKSAIALLRHEIFAREEYEVDNNPGVTGTHFAHVEVDTWTGSTKILDYLAVHDLGTAINPAMCRAQIQGAVQQGCGAALSEELVIDARGNATHSLSKYYLFNAPELPEIGVILVEDGSSRSGPFGAKSIGEVSFVPPQATIMAAVNRALHADLSVLPFSQDRIVQLISERETNET